MEFKRAVIVGSTGGLGSAIAKRLLSANPELQIAALSRTGTDDLNDHRVINISCDITQEASVQKAAEEVKNVFGGLDLMWNCTGVLRDDSVGLAPEKGMKYLNEENLTRSFQVNCFGVAYLGKHFIPILKKGERKPSIFASLSGRIASIEDNYRGGWHSYRAAKAAQHQILQCMQLEVASSTQIQVMALHPGFCATKLSAPFRTEKTPGVLDADFSAECLVNEVTNAKKTDRLQFIDWEGTTLPW